MKTAQEILGSKFEGLEGKIPQPIHSIQNALIVSAMKEYAKQWVKKALEETHETYITATVDEYEKMIDSHQ